MPNLSEEQIKALSAQIMAEVGKQKEEKATEDPLAQQTVERMVKEQLDQMEEKKRKGEFEEKAAGLIQPDETAEEFKAINAMGDDERINWRAAKMLSSKERLEVEHGPALARKIEDLKNLNDDALIITSMLHGAQMRKGRNQSFDQVYRSTKIYRLIHSYLANDKELQKAMAAATSGSGAEWIPTGFSSNVLIDIELQLRVAGLFNVVNMPTNPYTLPVQSSMATGYLISENTADEGIKITASTPGTTNATFTARKLAGRVVFSDEITEDSIVPIIPFVRQELAKAIARAHETAIINGDRTTAGGVAASHQDNAGTALFTSNQDARLAFDGLRYFALNQTDTSTKSFSAAPSDTLMGNTRDLAGKYGVNPSDCVWISSVNTYLQALYKLTNIATLDKYGPQATILTGEVMRYQGVPWVISEYLFSNLNTSGVYDGSTTDNSMLLFVYRPGFLNGYRGGVTLASEMDIETDQVKLVAKRRVDFVDPYDATATGNTMCVAGIDIST